MPTINDDLLDQETERLKSIWEDLNPIGDIVDNEHYDLIDNIDSPNTVFDKFDEEDLLQDQNFTCYQGVKINKYQEVKLLIQCFIKEVFDAIPAIAQSILEQNHDNLSNSGKNYQEQIYNDSIKYPL